MKKILASLLTIGVVASTAFYASSAYFNDTEEILGNSFTTGTIDISVGEKYTENLQIVDLKPSQHEYTQFIIYNDGSNPANIWKQLTFSQCNNEPISEPEEEAENGQPVCDLQDVVNYDMLVQVYDVDPEQNPSAQPIWFHNIYADEEGVDVYTMGEIYPHEGNGEYLGMLPADYYMRVEQSYHMDEETGNEYQGDSISYDLTLYAEQLTGTVYLDNKDQSHDWLIQHDDGISGTMTYTVKDKSFDWKVKAVAPLANTPYSVILYPEPSSTPSGSGWPRDVIVLGGTVTDGSGAISVAGSENFNYDLRNMKVWLVTDSDLTGDQMTGWHSANYLFERGLFDYYDSLVD